MRDAGAFLAIRSTASLTATRKDRVLAKPYIPYDGPIVTRKVALILRAKFYFTGNPCPRGHVSQRLVSNRSCHQCLFSWKEENYESHRKEVDKWHKENPERMRQHRTKWKRNNISKYRVSARMYQKGRSKIKGKYDENDVFNIGCYQDWRCVNCTKDISEKYHVDHIMPIKLGGENWPENLQLLCPNCNAKKSCKHPDKWDIENGRIPEVDGWRSYHK